MSRTGRPEGPGAPEKPGEGGPASPAPASPPLPGADSPPALPLFAAALGERWHGLPPPVRRLHSGRAVQSFSGRAYIARGRGLVARLAAWLVGLPEAGEDVPVTVTIACTPEGEVWERSFAGRRFKSVLTPSPQPCCLRERFGPATYELELPVADGVLHFAVRRGWLLGIPLPSVLLPRSCTTESAVDGTFHFDVGLYAPVTGALIVRYRGGLTPDATQPGPGAE